MLKSLITRFVFEGLQPINLSQLGFQIKGLFQFQIKLQSASSILRLDFVIGTPPLLSDPSQPPPLFDLRPGTGNSFLGTEIRCKADRCKCRGWLPVEGSGQMTSFELVTATPLRWCRGTGRVPHGRDCGRVACPDLWGNSRCDTLRWGF